MANIYSYIYKDYNNTSKKSDKFLPLYTEDEGRIDLI